MVDLKKLQKEIYQNKEFEEVKERTDNLINQLLEVWEDSVKATHTFLSNEEIEKIKTYVPQALKDIEHLNDIL